jgi:dTDP-4-amino-4,6-dideoxygalactose transaminase
LTIIQVADEQVRDHVLDTLAAQDIEARPTWKPMHLQPLYAEHRMYGGEVSEAAFATGICLPSGSSLTDADQDRVIAAVRESLQT